MHMAPGAVARRCTRSQTKAGLTSSVSMVCRCISSMGQSGHCTADGGGARGGRGGGGGAAAPRGGGQEDGQTVGEAKVGKVRGPLNGRWRHCAAAYCQQGGRHCTRPSGSWQAGRFKASIRPVACAQSTTAGGQPPKLHIWCHLHVCSRYNQAGANKESTPATHVVLRLDHRLGVRRQALVPAGHLLDVGNRLACT